MVATNTLTKSLTAVGFKSGSCLGVQNQTESKSGGGPLGTPLLCLGEGCSVLCRNKRLRRRKADTVCSHCTRNAKEAGQ